MVGFELELPYRLDDFDWKVAVGLFFVFGDETELSKECEIVCRPREEVFPGV